MRPEKVMVLAVKEARELSRERIVLFGLLLGPVLVFAFMGGVVGASLESAREAAARPFSIAVVWLGGEPPPPGLDEFVEALLDSGAGSVVVLGPRGDPAGAGVDAAVYVAPGDLEALLEGGRVRLRVEYYLDQASLLELTRLQAVERVLEEAATRLVAERCAACLPRATPESLLDPVDVEATVYYKGRVGSVEELMGLVSGVTIGIPVATMILAFAAMTVSAVSVGAEKEAKTLETLLTLPVTREELIAGKALGVLALVTLGILSYGAGLYIYMKSLEAATGGAPAQPSMALPGRAAAIILASLALSMLVASLMGFALGSLASDVRGAQMITSYAGLILVAPAFALMFGVSPESLPPAVDAVLHLDPFMLLVYAGYYAVTGETARAIAHTLGLLAHAAAWTIVAARLLSSEALITGAPRLRILGRRGPMR